MSAAIDDVRITAQPRMGTFVVHSEVLRRVVIVTTLERAEAEAGAMRAELPLRVARVRMLARCVECGLCFGMMAAGLPCPPCVKEEECES